MKTIMDKYNVIEKIGDGTFSEVSKCYNTVSNSYCACKRMRQKYENVEQVKQLREIQAMKQLRGHPNILHLYEVIYDRKHGTLYLIFELMERNLYEFVRKRHTLLSIKTIRKLTYQLVSAVDHMHRHGIFHRDIKPENILLDTNDKLKLGDFGSCKQISAGYPYTEYISTRWYRAPECLLTDGCYSFPMDIWSIGCVMFEITTLRPMFPGNNELDQIGKIHEVFGTPSTKFLNKLKYKTRCMDLNFHHVEGKGFSYLLPSTITSQYLELIHELLEYDFASRISATKALQHPFFDVLKKKKSLTISNSLSNTQDSGVGSSICDSKQEKSSLTMEDKFLTESSLKQRTLSKVKQRSAKSRKSNNNPIVVSIPTDHTKALMNALQSPSNRLTNSKLSINNNLQNSDTDSWANKSNYFNQIDSDIQSLNDEKNRRERELELLANSSKDLDFSSTSTKSQYFNYFDDNKSSIMDHNISLNNTDLSNDNSSTVYHLPTNDLKSKSLNKSKENRKSKEYTFKFIKKQSHDKLKYNDLKRNLLSSSTNMMLHHKTNNETMGRPNNNLKLYKSKQGPQKLPNLNHYDKFNSDSDTFLRQKLQGKKTQQNDLMSHSTLNHFNLPAELLDNRYKKAHNVLVVNKNNEQMNEERIERHKQRQYRLKKQDLQVPVIKQQLRSRNAISKSSYR
ncbi:hypothetical protein SNEBB_005493 [Seison nebaliae]|nr:hypothetical protein SNEBB_005493 [Seison nebaliae]